MKISNKNLILSSILTLSILFVGAPAQAQYKANAEKLEDTDSRAMVWAEEMGEVAGAANFCKLDPEILESFITRAQARIAAEARDEVELVVARIAFNNKMNTSSISAPDDGCDGFSDRFARESARVN